MTTLKRVMCLEDDPDIQMVLRFALEMEQIDFLVSDDGRDAVKMATEFKPDVILMDVMMPHSDGPTTLKTLQVDPQTASIPVVFMTARIQPQEVRDYVALGVKGVIAKPFDPMTLLAQLREICGGSS